MLKPGKKDHSSLSSYRPISLTSHISKLLESIIHTHLYYHIERHHLLSNTQFGFRTGRSTIHVLENIFTTITTSSTRFCAVANFDFRGADRIATGRHLIPHSVEHWCQLPSHGTKRNSTRQSVCLCRRHLGRFACKSNTTNRVILSTIA